MGMKTDGVILDVDGTLWDSTGVVAKAWTRAVRENGCTDMTVTAGVLRGLFGRTMDVIAENLLPDLTQEQRNCIMKACCVYEQQELSGIEVYPMEGEPGMPPLWDCPLCYPGVSQTIRELSKKLPVFIVSNCQAGYIELFLDKTGLGPYVTDTECFGNTGHGKSDNILLLAKRNGLKAPVYVGDTQGDADAAAEAGIPIVFASYGFGTVEHPDAEISGFSELPDLFGYI